MTAAAVDAVRADHAALAELAEGFRDEEWNVPSACEGWSVRDVLAHLTQVFRQAVDPGSLPPGDPSGSTERNQDRWVEALRDRPVADVLAEYRSLGEQALALFAGLDGVEDTIDLGDLGTHPLHLVPNIYAFDHYTHIRADILRPRGPIDRPTPPVTDDHLGAIADWIVAGIPQTSPAAATEPIELELTGPGGRTAHVGPEGEPLATVTSTVPDLVLWVTRREPWSALDVTVRGDEAAAQRFLDAVFVF